MRLLALVIILATAWLVTGTPAAGDAVDGDYGVGGFAGLQELIGVKKPVIACVNGVAALPGRTVLTRTAGASSSAIALVIDRTPPLLAA